MWMLSAQPLPPSRPSLENHIANHQDNLHALVSCLAVSKTWRRLASDNSVWRAFFTSRWGNMTKLSSSSDFSYLFKQRYELDQRWNAISRTGAPTFSLWEPKRFQLIGHWDRYDTRPPLLQVLIAGQCVLLGALSNVRWRRLCYHRLTRSHYESVASRHRSMFGNVW